MSNGSCIVMTVDTNGIKLPNKIARDKYTFVLCFDDRTRGWYLGKKLAFGPYTNCPACGRNGALTRCRETSSYCARLLELDNWEFKDDYPYKF